VKRHAIAATLCVAAFSLLQPGASFAQIEQVRIVVDGLSCNLCAAGLERSLRHVPGVSKVQVTLEQEAALVTLKAGTPFEAEALRTAVRNAGQQARQFELTLRASVERQDGRYRLVPNAGSPLAVARSSEPKLDAYVGQVVHVRARVSSLARSPLELELTDVALR